MDNEMTGFVLAIPSTLESEVVIDTSLGVIRVHITLPAQVAASKITGLPFAIADAVLRVTEAHDG